MNATQKAMAQKCFAAAYDGSMDFPSIVGALIGAGFEGYVVDYRRNTSTYYLPEGDSVELSAESSTSSTPSTIAAEFKPELVAEAVRAAQAAAEGYTYRGFCEQVKAAGCAGYIVSFLGKRVLYFGRTAETHVEHFPQ